MDDLHIFFGSFHLQSGAGHFPFSQEHTGNRSQSDVTSAEGETVVLWNNVRLRFEKFPNPLDGYTPIFVDYHIITPLFSIIT